MLPSSPIHSAHSLASAPHISPPPPNQLPPPYDEQPAYHLPALIYQDGLLAGRLADHNNNGNQHPLGLQRRALIDSNLGLIASIAVCMTAGMAGGIVVSTFALRGVSPITGALIGAGAGLAAALTKIVFDRLLGFIIAEPAHEIVNPPLVRGADRRPLRTTEIILNSIKTASAVLFLEGGLSSLMMVSYSPITGAVFGWTSAIVDTVVGIAFNILHLQNKWIKLATKTLFTGLAAIATLHALGLPNISLLGIVALKIGVKKVLMPLFMDLFQITITHPIALLRNRTVGLTNLRNPNNNSFELKNFMWPTHDLS